MTTKNERTLHEESVLKTLLWLEKRGLVKRIGSKDMRKAKWGRTKFGNLVYKGLKKQGSQKSEKVI